MPTSGMIRWREYRRISSLFSVTGISVVVAIMSLVDFRLAGIGSMNRAERELTTGRATRTTAHCGGRVHVRNYEILSQAAPPAMEGTIEMLSPSCSAVAS